MGISLNQFGGNTVLNAVYIYDDITAQVDTRYLTNTTTKSITVTLPKNPVRGDVIEIIDATGTANTEPTEGFGFNPSIIKLNPDTQHPISGVDGDLILDNDGIAITLVYDGYTTWLIKQVTVNTLNVNKIENTDDLPEGENQYYYSDAKVDDRLSNLSITSLGNVDLLTDLPEDLDCLVYKATEEKWVPARPIPSSTDVIPEGVNNLYYSDTKVNTKLSISSINLFTDVNANSPQVNDVLTWNGVRWESISTNTSVWNNANFSNNLVDNGIPYYNSDNSQWETAQLTSLAQGSLKLIDLKDVESETPLESLSDDQVLIYKNSLWNVTPVTSLGSTVTIPSLSDVQVDSIEINDLLIYDGTNFVNKSLSTLAGTNLTVEDISNVTNDIFTEAVLIKDSSSNWVVSGFSNLAGKLNLTDLKDITEAPNDKSILQYESGIGGWVYTNVNTIVGDSIASNLDYSLIGGYLTNQSLETFRNIEADAKEDDILISKIGKRPLQVNRVVNSSANDNGKFLKIVYSGAGLFVSRNPPVENQEDSFTVALNEIPPDTVYVNISSPNTADYVLSTATLAFNDDSPQTVTISSKTDNLGQPSKTISLTLETTDSSPETFRDITIVVNVDIFDDYNVWTPIPAKSLPFNFTDLKDVNNINDGELIVANQNTLENPLNSTVFGDVIVNHPDPLTLTREGVKEFLKIKLSSPPAINNPRTVIVNSTLLNLNKTLTFEHYNWDMEQIIELSANNNTQDTGTITIDSNDLNIEVIDAEYSIQTVPRISEKYNINNFKPDAILGWFLPPPGGSKTEGVVQNSKIKIEYPPLLIGHEPITIKLQLLESITGTLVVNCFSQGLTDTVEFYPEDWNCPRYYKFYRDLDNGDYKLSIYTDDFVELLDYTVDKNLPELQEISSFPFDRQGLKHTNFVDLKNRDIEIYEEVNRPIPFNNDITSQQSQLIIRTVDLEENLYISINGLENKGNLTDTIKIKLSEAPPTEKRVNIVGYNLEVSQNFIEFTDSNWDTFQSITISSGVTEGIGLVNISEQGGTDYYQLKYSILDSRGKWVNKSINQLVEESNNENAGDIDGGGGLIGDVEEPPTDNDDDEDDIVNINPNDEQEELRIVSVSPSITEDIILNPTIIVEFNQEVIPNGKVDLISNNITIETFNLVDNSSNLDGFTNISDNILTIKPTTLLEDTEYSLYLNNSAVTDKFNIGIAPTTLIQFNTFAFPPVQYNTASEANILVAIESNVTIAKTTNSLFNIILSGSSSQNTKRNVKSKSEINLGYRSEKKKILASKSLMTIWGESLTAVSRRVPESYHQSSTSFILLEGSSQRIKLPVRSESEITIIGSSQKSNNKINNIVTTNKFVASKADLILQGSTVKLKQPIKSKSKLLLTGSTVYSKQTINNGSVYNTSSTADLLLGFFTDYKYRVTSSGVLTLTGWSNKQKTNNNTNLQIKTSSSCSLEIKGSTFKRYPTSSTSNLSLVGESYAVTTSTVGDKNIHTRADLIFGYSSFIKKINTTNALINLAGNSQKQVTRSGNGPIKAAQVVSTTPSNNSTNAAVTTEIKLIYDKDVTVNSGVITLLKDDQAIELFDVTTQNGDNGGSLSINNNTLTVSPGVGLEESRVYEVSIPDNALIDSDSFEVSGYNLSFATRGAGSLVLRVPNSNIVLSRGGSFNTATVSFKLDSIPSNTVDVFVTTQDSQVVTDVQNITLDVNNYNTYHDILITAPSTNFSDTTNTRITINTESEDSTYDSITKDIPIEIRPVNIEKKSISLETLENYILWSKDVNYTNPSDGDILYWQTDKFINKTFSDVVSDEVSADSLISYETTPVGKNSYVAVRIGNDNWKTRKLSLQNFDTSDLAEGSNKYYTDTKVETFISSSIGLEKLKGVSISNLQNNSILSYDSSTSTWVVKDIVLPETTDDLSEGNTNKYLSASNLQQLSAKNLGDVNYGTPSDNDLLSWNATEGEWRSKSINDLPLSLRDLDGVKDQAAADNQILAWNLTQGWWEPTNISSVVENLSTDDIVEANNKYYSTTLFTSDFNNTIINTNLSDLGNVNGNATAGAVLVFNGSNWNPQDLEYSILGYNLSNIEINKTVQQLQFNKNSGLYLVDNGNTVEVNYKIPHWTDSAQLLTSNGTNTELLLRGTPGQVLSINSSSVLEWVSPRPAFLRVITISGDYTLSQSDHYSLFKINDSLTLTLSDDLIKGSYLRCRIASDNVSLSFATSGNAVIISEIPNVNELNAEVLLIYEGYNLTGDAEWSIRMTSGASDVSVTGLLIKTNVQSTNFIATKFTIYPVNTSSQPITVTLPNSPSDGDSVQFYDYNGSHPSSVNYPSGFGLNPLNIQVNDPSQNINGNESIQLSSDNSSCTLQFDSSKNTWFITNGITDTTSIVVGSNNFDGQSNYEYYYDYTLPGCQFYNSFIHKSAALNTINFSANTNELVRHSTNKIIKATDLGISLRGINNNTFIDYYEFGLASLDNFSVVLKIDNLKGNSDIEFLDVFGYRFGIGSGRLFSRREEGKELDVQFSSQLLVITKSPSLFQVYLEYEQVYSSTSLDRLQVKDNCQVGALILPKYHSIRLRDLGIYSKVLTETEILNLS